MENSFHFYQERLVDYGEIRLNNERAVILETQALCAILRLAYDQCRDWTEFIRENQAIAKHPRIEDHNVEAFYEAAFEKVKEDLREEAQAARPRKIGPVGFAAPESALLLEKRRAPRRRLYQSGEVVRKFEEYFRGLDNVWYVDNSAADVA
uniref:V-type proton ATPase subunit a n=1 Tax=Haemonchus contortus TaxID=6289 RepID=A0A7I4XXA9_HAECO|nr:unnamed protein product [Haemonchus contortus]